MPFGDLDSDQWPSDDIRDDSTFTQVDLNVGDVLWIGEQRLCVLDIEGDEAIFRLDSPDDDHDPHSEDTGWSDRPR